LSEQRKQNYLSGAAILAFTTALTKIIGLIYKYPVLNILGDAGAAHFDVTYRVYNLLLTISTAGIPVALSRLIAAANATGRSSQVKKYFRVGMLTFIIIGAICSGIMVLFPSQIAGMMGDPGAAPGIAVLGPGVLFVCIISVYRGYSQGFQNMIPTAISQIIEVVSKAVIGIAIALWLSRMHYESPAISAGAIMGVTVGLGISIPVLMLEKRKSDRRRGRPDYSDTPLSSPDTFKEIMKISIPVTLSSSILNIISLIDTKIILSRLEGGAGFDHGMTEVLYGVYAKAFNITNIPSSIVVALTVSIVPAIAAAVATRNTRQSKAVMESSLRVTNLFAMPCAIGIAVLAYPIFNVFFPNSNEAGPVILAILGVSSYFICVQLVLNAILQANGFERLALISLPIGGIVMIITDYILVSNPNINIYGAPVGTLLCYIAIMIFDMLFIRAKIKGCPNFLKVVIRPLICSLVMGVTVWAIYGIVSRHAGNLISLVLGVGCGVVVYFVMVFAIRAITREDMLLLPKGEKLANMLRL
jgi:stage V sporulation protein B